DPRNRSLRAPGSCRDRARSVLGPPRPSQRIRVDVKDRRDGTRFVLYLGSVSSGGSSASRDAAGIGADPAHTASDTTEAGQAPALARGRPNGHTGLPDGTQVTDMNQAQAEAVPRPAAGAGAQGVELRHLRYFAAVADAGTFTRAAERLFVAQPTLSQQIQRLEQIVGTPLLHRRRAGVQLTAAGPPLLAAAPAAPRAVRPPRPPA